MSTPMVASRPIGLRCHFARTFKLANALATELHVTQELTNVRSALATPTVPVDTGNRDRQLKALAKARARKLERARASID